MTNIVLKLDEVPMPVPEASEFVILVQHHLPPGVQVHVMSNTLENDGSLPEFPLTSAEGFAVGHEPWEPEQFPAIGEHYADATLARASFSEWFNDLREW